MKGLTDKYRNIIKGSGVGTWLWNVKYGEVEFNENAVEILGYHFKEINVCLIEELKKLAHPEDLKKREIELKLYFSGKKKVYECLLRMKHKNGNWIWLLVRGSVIERGDDGEPLIMAGIVMDITNRKRYEENLSKNDERFQKLFHKSRDGMYIRSYDGYIEDVNDSFLKIHGFDRDEVIGKKSWEFLHPDSLTKIKELKQKGEWENDIPQVRIITKTGEKRYVEISTFTLESSDDNKKIAGTIRDVTDKKKAQERLKTSEKNFNQFFQSMDDLIFVGTIEGRILFINQAVSTKLGYSQEELTKMHILDVHPKDKREEAERVFAEMFRGERDTCPLPLQKKNGELLPVETKVWFGKWNENEVIYGISKDLSKQQAALDKFTKLFDSNPALMSVSSLKTKEILDVNRAFVDTLGYQKHEVLGRTSRDLNFFVDPEKQKNLADMLLRTGRVREKEVKVKTKSGKILTGLISGEVIDNQYEKVYLSVMTDITKQKEAEEKAKEASRAKSEFLANMSHEIRTPLNGIIGFSELLQRSGLNKKQQEYMQAVKNSADSLMDIINDILDFSKIEAGKLELNPEKTDIIQLCEDIIDIVKFRAQDKALELLLDVKNHVPKYTWVDAVRLKQILVNLLGNAIKFTENGQVVLKVMRIENEKEGNNEMDSITFRVEDTGIGIGEKNRAKIFEAFSQEDLSTTKKFGGTGLGLAISNRLLKMMDSQLLLESELGKGSTFYFTLSLRVEDNEDHTHELPENIQHILLIDDNEDSRKILRENLELMGVSISEAKNGFEGLEQLTNRQDFDLLIIDYHMPYMNGIEVVKTIREKFELSHNELPVILLHSSSEDEELRRNCLKYKIAANILKPIKMSKFIEILSRLKNIEIIEEEQAVIHEEKAKGAVSISGLKKILIAEDNATNMLFAKTTVNQLLPEAEIIEAVNGEEAVKMAKEKDFDLIFMDVRMPKMDGYAATRAIRKFNKETRIIALTAGVIKGERERCVEAGMNDYLPKPVTIDAIERVLFNNLSTIQDERATPPSSDEKKVLFNKELLYKRLAGNAELINQALDLFKTDIIEKIKILQEVDISKQEPEILINLFHSIKGQAANLSFQRLMKSAEILENNAAKGRIDEINMSLKDFVVTLKEHLEIINENLQ